MYKVDPNRLLKLRLVVGRFGEMDMARWWNTQGVLGRHGAALYRRGFPGTHHFVQARVVFAVARARCREVFDPPGCVTLWNLPAELEDRFEDRWHEWLEEGESWRPFFESLAHLRKDDLLDALEDLHLLTGDQRAQVGRLRRSAEGRAVPLPGMSELDDDALTLLAAGFARGERGRPAIPYARLGA